MKLRHRLQGRKYSLLAAFLIPFLGMLGVMLVSQYKPFGKYSMLYSDMYHQYYPFFVAFRDALREGKSLLYSWSVGMGLDYLGLIAYYVASPLNLLSVLVPDGWLLSYFSLLVPIKLGLASLFFAIFLRSVTEREDISIAVFGGCYGLCAWALGFQWNIMWVDTFALLPLVILGQLSLLRRRRFALYTITLFLSVFSNYYIGLFTCFFVGLVFFCYEICRFPGWGRFFRDLGWMALFSALAIGMTAILTLPAYAALQTTQSSVNAFPTGFRLNIADENTILGLLDAMRQVAGNMGGGIEPNFKEGLPNLYCGVGSLLLAVLYLYSDRVSARDKIASVFLLLFFNLSFIIRQLDYIWHGFHFTNMIPYRFSFLHSFVVLYMAYRGWTLRSTFQPWEILSAFVVTFSLLACCQDLYHKETVEFLGLSFSVYVYILYNLSFLLLVTAGLLYGCRKPVLSEEPDPRELREADRWKRAVCRVSSSWVLLTMSLELIATLVSFGLYFPGTSVSNYPKGTEEAASMIRYMKERERTGDVYRAETTHSQTLNDGALNDYNGISTFTSSANVHVTEFMKALGYGAKNTYNRYCFEESSPVANLFLNLKYMIERDGRERGSSVFEDVHHYGDVHLLKNRAYLPLGFLAEPALAEVDFDTNANPFAFQDTLFTAATGIQEDVWHRIPGDQLEIIPTGVTVTDKNDSGYCAYSDCESGSELVYSYLADQAGFACIHLNLPKRNDFIVSVNGAELYRESISLPQMLAVADVQPGDVIDIRIMCDKDESSTMTVSAAIMDMDVFWQGYQVLNRSVLKISSFKETRVEGNVQCDRDGLLYVSIPQTGNWKAYVNGQFQETQLVGDCMIGLTLSAGEHHILLQYENAAFSLAWKISFGCLGVFLLLWWLQQGTPLPPRRKSGRYQRTA